MTDIRSNLGSARLAGEQRRHRHIWVRFHAPDGTFLFDGCACGVHQDAVKTRAGRSARNRGNRRELELAKTLGGTKVGQYGGPEDVRVGLFVIQSKVRRNFPTWMTAELAKLPRTDGRIPLLVVTDSPGPGQRRKSIVVLSLEDWRDLHGEEQA